MRHLAGERHTRQGQPRREITQVRGPDELDEERDWTPTPRRRGGSAYLGRVIAGPGCWCGQHMGHDWPGRDEGAPHPREDR